MHLFTSQEKCLANGLIPTVPFARAHQASFQILSSLVAIVGEGIVIDPGILINLILHDLDLRRSKVMESHIIVQCHQLRGSNFLEI